MPALIWIYLSCLVTIVSACSGPNVPSWLRDPQRQSPRWQQIEDNLSPSSQRRGMTRADAGCPTIPIRVCLDVDHQRCDAGICTIQTIPCDGGSDVAQRPE